MPVTNQTPVITYTANGSVTTFAYPFRVAKQSDLFVYVDATQVISGFSVTGIDNASGGNVVFSAAPANGAVVRIQRVTSLDRTTDYVEGGQLAASVLDNDFDRVVMMIQDLNQSPLLETADGLFDAEGKRIKNLADPVNATDAVNKQYVEGTYVPQLNALVTSATTQATNAATSATNAANSASSALTHLNTFKGQYYGSLSSTPTTDPIGNAITVGDMYFNTTTNRMMIYTGSTWDFVTPTKFAYQVTSTAAAGNSQGTAAQLGIEINVVTSATATTADGVKLPTPDVGSYAVVINSTNVSIKVYPNTGGIIEYNAANAPITIGPYSRLPFVATSSTQWYAMTSVYA